MLFRSLYVLPLGIIAFAGQLSAQIEAGVIVGALGKYTAVVIGGNAIQFFIILPLIMLLRGLNPVKVFRKMAPALAVALFTKSSAGTLPVTLACAEQNLKANPKVSRFVLPICTTINMNGCAAFILVTSLFVMQNAGFELSMTTMITWLFISVIAAVGNAGVPMGCYFLTLSLMSSIGAPIGLLGIILPIYTIIDMIETAENVCVEAVAVLEDVGVGVLHQAAGLTGVKHGGHLAVQVHRHQHQADQDGCENHQHGFAPVAGFGLVHAGSPLFLSVFGIPSPAGRAAGPSTAAGAGAGARCAERRAGKLLGQHPAARRHLAGTHYTPFGREFGDRKSTRLNSSHWS